MNELSQTFAPIEPTEFDRMWIEQHERVQREIAGIYAIPSPLFDLSFIDLVKLRDDLKTTYRPQTIYIASEFPVCTWTFSPKTYESIKLAHHFPLPTRKLRKVQLRRITQRKLEYRKHRARVNAAISERVGKWN